MSADKAILIILNEIQPQTPVLMLLVSILIQIIKQNSLNVIEYLLKYYDFENITYVY